MIIIADTSPIHYLILINEIEILGTLAILEDAAKKDLLDLPDAVEKIKRTNFHLPPSELTEAMLERNRKRKQQ
ncbi:MAG: hypothetical protein ACREA2_20570 [Blastocatellia bacterium]